MFNFFSALGTKLLGFLMAFLSALLSGGLFTPPGSPSMCDQMAEYTGLSALPAGVRCSDLSLHRFMPNETVKYEARGTLTPAAVDSWLAAQSPGFDLTQQPCWTDLEGCSLSSAPVKLVDGVWQKLNLSVGAFHVDRSVNFRITSQEWQACQEQPCLAEPWYFSDPGCLATVAQLDSLAGASSAATYLGDEPYLCSYAPLSTHPWWNATYRGSSKNLDAWMALAGSVEPVTCPVVSTDSSLRSCWHITAGSSVTVDVTWSQSGYSSPSVTLRIAK